MDESVERRHALFSAVADNEARKAVAVDNFTVWQTLEDMLNKKKKCIQMVKSYHDFLCELPERTFKLLL